MPPKPRRQLTTYNIFMQKTVPKLREKHPDLPHRAVFAKAAEAWRKSPENPDNRFSRMPAPPSSSATSGSKKRNGTGAASSSTASSSRK